MLNYPMLSSAGSDPPADAIECFHLPAILFKVDFGILGSHGFTTFLDCSEVAKETDVTFSISMGTAAATRGYIRAVA